MSAATATKCPSWCVWGDECRGDHWADPGNEQWSGVRATAYPAGGEFTIYPHPTWGQVDGLDPAVGLWLQGKLDETIDLTPSEARELIQRLQAALDALEPRP